MGDGKPFKYTPASSSYRQKYDRIFDELTGDEQLKNAPEALKSYYRTHNEDELLEAYETLRAIMIGMTTKLAKLSSIHSDWTSFISRAAEDRRETEQESLDHYYDETDDNGTTKNYDFLSSHYSDIVADTTTAVNMLLQRRRECVAMNTRLEWPTERPSGTGAPNSSWNSFAQKAPEAGAGVNDGFTSSFHGHESRGPRTSVAPPNPSKAGIDEQTELRQTPPFQNNPPQQTTSPPPQQHTPPSFQNLSHYHHSLQYPPNPQLQYPTIHPSLHGLPYPNANLPYPQAMMPPPGFPRLPRIELMKFDGEISRWKIFWQQFNEIVHSRPDLSHSDKYAYLNGCVEGDAKRVIEALPMLSENYLMAIQMLKQQYNDEQSFRLVIKKRIMHLKAKSDDPRDLMQMYNEVKALLTQASYTGEVQKNHYLILDVLAKFPRFVQEHVRLHFDSNDYTMDEMLEVTRKLLSMKMFCDEMDELDGSTTNESRVRYNDGSTVTENCVRLNNGSPMNESRSRIMNNSNGSMAIESMERIRNVSYGSTTNESRRRKTNDPTGSATTESPERIHNEWNGSTVTENRARIKNEPNRRSNVPNYRNDQNPPHPIRPHAEPESGVCPLCGDTHQNAMTCDKVKTIEERHEVIMKKGLCRRCLGRSHLARTCDKTCHICQGPHHAAICDTNTTNQEFNAHNCRLEMKARLFTTRVTIMNPITQKKLTCDALLDEGSTTTLMSRKFAEELGINLSNVRRTQMSGIQGVMPVTDYPVVNPLISYGDNEVLEFEALVKDDPLTAPLRFDKLDEADLKVVRKWRYRNNKMNHCGAAIDIIPSILFGIREKIQIVGCRRKTLPSGFIMMESILGPVVGGVIHDDSQLEVHMNHIIHNFRSPPVHTNYESEPKTFLGTEQAPTITEDEVIPRFRSPDKTKPMKSYCVTEEWQSSLNDSSLPGSLAHFPSSGGMTMSSRSVKKKSSVEDVLDVEHVETCLHQQRHDHCCLGLRNSKPGPPTKLSQLTS